MVSDVGALVLMSCQCLNIRPGVGGMFTRGPSRSRSRDNSAPAPINSGVGSQQRSLHWALSPATRGQGLSTQRSSTPSWPPIDLLRETANMSSVDKYVIQFCSKNKTNLLRLYGSWMFKRIEHQMCIGDISNMKNESYETFQFIAMYLSCPCCFNSISTTHPLTFKNNITSNEIKINQHSSTSTSYPTIRLDSICSLNQCILSVQQDQPLSNRSIKE